MIRIAVVGLGKIARDAHLPTIDKDARYALAATVGRSVGIDDLPHFPSIEELAASGLAIDAVAICTPPQVRIAIAHAAIEAGFDVMLEKPPAATCSALDGLVAAAARRGVVLMATWHSRHAPMVERARQWLEGRVVKEGRIIWREDVRHWHPGQTWLWQPGGLGVFDPGINALSILTVLTQLPVVVEAATFEVPENCHAPIAAQLRLSLGEASIAVDLDFRQTGLQTWDIELTAADGAWLALRMGGAELAIDNGVVEATRPDEYAGIYDRFADLVAARQSDADARPLKLVADAFLIARAIQVAPFEP